MRYSMTSASAAVALLLFAPPVLSQGIYGVSSGLILEAWPNYNPPICPPATCCGGTDLMISEGTYYLAGTPHALSPQRASFETTYSGGTMDGGACGSPPPVTGGLAPDTVYYCYETQIPSLTCSTTSPWPNGQPSAPVTADGGTTQNVIFVGSFVTDNNAQIVPEKRIGEQVLLKVQSDGGVYADAGAPDGGIVFSGGLAVCGWPKGAGVNCRNIAGTAASDTFAPFYPVSAAAGIFDVHVVNNNIEVPDAGPGSVPTSNYALIKFYDAVSYYTFPGFQQSVQAEFGIGGGAASGVPEVETVRLTLNANKLPPPYSKQFSVANTEDWGQFAIEPTVPTGVSAIVVLRGYIEPIQRLFSR